VKPRGVERRGCLIVQRAVRSVGVVLDASAPSVKTVQARLGHANAGETLDTYAHLWPDAEDRTREAVDEVLGADVAPMWPKQAPA